ncbi:hypothetical protein S245_062134, partial [Arachis hypogaea]
IVPNLHQVLNLLQLRTPSPGAYFRIQSTLRSPHLPPFLGFRLLEASPPIRRPETPVSTMSSSSELDLLAYRPPYASSSSATRKELIYRCVWWRKVLK